MNKARNILAIPVFMSLIWASAAEAKPPRINFSGCVRPGVESGCLIVHSGQVLFNLSAARPRPRLNRWIAGSGIRADGVTFCQQGVALTAVRWHYVRRLCRPLPLPPRRY